MGFNPSELLDERHKNCKRCHGTRMYFSAPYPGSDLDGQWFNCNQII